MVVLLIPGARDEERERVCERECEGESEREGERARLCRRKEEKVYLSSVFFAVVETASIDFNRANVGYSLLLVSSASTFRYVEGNEVTFTPHTRKITNDDEDRERKSGALGSFFFTNGLRWPVLQNLGLRSL